MNKPTSANRLQKALAALYIVVDETVATDIGKIAREEIEQAERRGVIKGLRMAVQDFNFYRETAKVIEDEIVRLESELNTEPGEGSK